MWQRAFRPQGSSPDWHSSKSESRKIESWNSSKLRAWIQDTLQGPSMTSRPQKAPSVALRYREINIRERASRRYRCIRCRRWAGRSRVPSTRIQTHTCRSSCPRCWCRRPSPRRSPSRSGTRHRLDAKKKKEEKRGSYLKEGRSRPGGPGFFHFKKKCRI